MAYWGQLKPNRDSSKIMTRMNEHLNGEVRAIANCTFRESKEEFNKPK